MNLFEIFFILERYLILNNKKWEKKEFGVNEGGASLDLVNLQHPSNDNKTQYIIVDHLSHLHAYYIYFDFVSPLILLLIEYKLQTLCSAPAISISHSTSSRSNLGMFSVSSSSFDQYFNFFALIFRKGFSNRIFCLLLELINHLAQLLG